MIDPEKVANTADIPSHKTSNELAEPKPDMEHAQLNDKGFNDKGFETAVPELPPTTTEACTSWAPWSRAARLLAL